MSDSTESGWEWRFYVEDMIAFAGKCLAYTEGMDQYSFVSSALTYDATLRNLELIGEAATRLPDEVRAAHPEIPWRRRGFGLFRPTRAWGRSVGSKSAGG